MEINTDGNRRSRTTLVLQYQQSSGALYLNPVGKVNKSTYLSYPNLTVWPGNHYHCCYFIIILYSDGIPPDGHPVDVISLILVPVVVFGCTLMGILLAFAIVCLCFNIIFRNRKLVNLISPNKIIHLIRVNRIVKLTSPNLNYIMIFGAFAQIYSGIPIVTNSIATQAFKCNVR